MDKEEIRRIFNLLLVDHNPQEFLKYCTDDVKFILHPRHVAAGIYDRKSIFNLFEHLAKSFPHWTETIENVYHDSKERVFITIAKGNSSTIKGIWDIHILHYDENNKIFKIEERIDTLHLAEGNVGPRI
tara:strand:+ start:3042 stop:3428 length:387 start_codon:yes stop_codon:yes gene_type:complete